MNPTLYYCYDAYCGWCYGFSPVMRQLAARYKDRLHIEVLSGGMIPADHPAPIDKVAGFIGKAYSRVEELTGIRFGPDFLWHIFNPEKSDWLIHSEKSAAALCIFKEIDPENQVDFAADLQLALNFEGRDLTDDEAYRHLLEKYQIDPAGFYSKLNSEEYREKARYEFALCRQLQVTAFPVLLMQESETKFYLLSKGFTPLEELEQRIENVLYEISQNSSKQEI